MFYDCEYDIFILSVSPAEQLPLYVTVSLILPKTL